MNFSVNLILVHDNNKIRCDYIRPQIEKLSCHLKSFFLVKKMKFNINQKLNI